MNKPMSAETFLRIKATERIAESIRRIARDFGLMPEETYDICVDMTEIFYCDSKRKETTTKP
jgi:hypothetical protein